MTLGISMTNSSPPTPGEHVVLAYAGTESLGHLAQQLSAGTGSVRDFCRAPRG
jgi:hypothetical protein